MNVDPARENALNSHPDVVSASHPYFGRCHQLYSSRAHGNGLVGDACHASHMLNSTVGSFLLRK